MAIAAVDDDVVEDDLPVRIIVAAGLQPLKGANLHAIFPVGEAGLIPVRGLSCAFLQSTGNLPCAESGELHDEQRTDNQR